MNASSNSALFVYIGVIVVMVQGYFVGKWSRKFGDRWLIVMGLLVLGMGLLLTAFTPRVPVPWYSQSALTEELSGDVTQPAETPQVDDIQIELPDDSQTGWFGLFWIIAAMVPAAIGGGVLQPSINSMITKQVLPIEIGGILGISASFLSGANAITPW
jgi:MFS family permease